MAPSGRNVPARPRISLPLLCAVSAMGDAGRGASSSPSQVTVGCQASRTAFSVVSWQRGWGVCVGGGGPTPPRGIVAAGREGLVWMAGSFIWPQRAV